MSLNAVNNLLFSQSYEKVEQKELSKTQSGLMNGEGVYKKPRGRPRINPIKDDAEGTEPKKPRGRQVGFKVTPKPKIELDAETLKQKKTEINKKTYHKRGKTIQAINNIVIKNDLEPINYKNMTDDELKQKYTELLSIYKGLQIQKQKEQLETKLKKLTEKIAPINFSPFFTKFCEAIEKGDPKT